MRIAIIGSGGVGGYFGGRLSKAGFDVTFVARGSHLKAIQENGLRIRSIAGNILIDTVQATDKISELSRPDLIIIGTKAGQVKEIRNEIKKILQPNSIILPLQNGILAANELQEVIDESHILGGLCRIISKIEGPGIIHHFAINPIIVFGELNKIHSERVAAVKTIFDTAQIDSIISDDIEADLW